MTLEFTHTRHGTRYRVTLVPVRIEGEWALRTLLSWNSGFGGGQRTGDNLPVTSDVIALCNNPDTPRWLLADALAEIGLDDGMSNVVRGT